MTTSQLDLFTGDAPEVHSPAPGLSIQARFEEFHRLNPWVADALIRLARDMVARGRTRIGVKHLVEIVRWQWNRATTDPTTDLRINNVYTSRYSRLLEDLAPDLRGVFEQRVLRAA